MFSKFLIVTAIIGLVLALEETYEPKSDNYKIENVCIDQLNEQIRLEMHASLNYMNMAAHFNNPHVALYGLGKFFKKAALEEQDHATKIIDYINKRGGQIKAIKVDPSTKCSFTNMLESLEHALKLENIVNNQLHLVHHKAELECKDSHLMDFIEEVFFNEQIEAIHQLKGWIAKLRRMGDGLGEEILDQEISKIV